MMLLMGEESLRGAAMKPKDYQELFVCNLTNCQPTLYAFISPPARLWSAALCIDDARGDVNPNSASLMESQAYGMDAKKEQPKIAASEREVVRTDYTSTFPFASKRTADVSRSVCGMHGA
jgi:hypothetical protein